MWLPFSVRGLLQWTEPFCPCSLPLSRRGDQGSNKYISEDSNMSKIIKWVRRLEDDVWRYKVAFGQMLGRGQELSQVAIWDKSVAGRGQSKCNDPEATHEGTYLEHSWEVRGSARLEQWEWERGQRPVNSADIKSPTCPKQRSEIGRVSS